MGHPSRTRLVRHDEMDGPALVSPVSPSSSSARRPTPPEAQTPTAVTWTSRPSPFTAFETMQYFSAS